MKTKQRVHPADLPENRKKKLPDYMKAPWSPKETRAHAQELDERERGNRRRR